MMFVQMMSMTPMLHGTCNIQGGLTTEHRSTKIGEQKCARGGHFRHQCHDCYKQDVNLSCSSVVAFGIGFAMVAKRHPFVFEHLFPVVSCISTTEYPHRWFACVAFAILQWMLPSKRIVVLRQCGQSASSLVVMKYKSSRCVYRFLKQVWLIKCGFQ